MMKLVCFIYLVSALAIADPCAEWFKKSGIKLGPNCLNRCSALPTGMDTFVCPQRCQNFCKSGRCRDGEHWVDSYHQRKYVRGDGKLVSEKEMPGHCQKNSANYLAWNPKLKGGKPEAWRPAAEQASQWTTEQRERVISVLDETPDWLKDPKIFGIYRLKESIPPGNPASNDYADFVLYDNAFDSDFNLAKVLDHELSHRLYENLSENEKKDFREVGGWHLNNDTGEFQAKRPEDQFLRKNGLLSPTEDFADDIAEFATQPDHLKSIAPKVYTWIQNHFGNKLRSRSKP